MYICYVGEIRAEWESLREHDVVFLICIDKPKLDSIIADKNNFNYNMDNNTNNSNNTKITYESFQDEILNFREKYGVKYVRGGEIFEIRDEDGKLIHLI